jgi:VanZ family protein
MTTISYMAFIWVLSSFALSIPAIEIVPFKDKGVHFIEYGILGTLSSFAFYQTFPTKRVRALVFAILLTIIWGILDEVHQYFVPGRISETWDALADSLGGICAVAIFFFVISRLTGKTTMSPKRP